MRISSSRIPSRVSATVEASHVEAVAVGAAGATARAAGASGSVSGVHSGVIYGWK